MRTHLLALSTVALSALACSSGDAPTSPAPVGVVDDAATAASYGVPKHVAVTRAYFHRYTDVQPTDADATKYVVFDLAAASKITIELKAPQSKAGFAGGVYGDLYRVTKGGGLAYLGSLDGANGDVSASFTSTKGGSYVIGVSEYGAGYAVEVDLTCNRADGKCAHKAQPDDACGGIAGITCDQGLSCQPSLGKGQQCPVPDAGGVCQLATDVPCGAAPSCGCDGKDYATGCDARQAGVFVKQPFPCSCDPKQYSLLTTATVASLSGPYSTSWTVGFYGHNVDVSFDPATATYTESATVGPVCTTKGQPCPTGKTDMGTASGTYKVVGGVVTLQPTTTTGSAAMPTALTIESSCSGLVVLRSHEDASVQQWDVPDLG